MESPTDAGTGLHQMPEIGFPASSDGATWGAETALLIIDMVYGNVSADYGMAPVLAARGVSCEYFLDRVDRHLVPNINLLRERARRRESKIIYTAVGSSYDDYRDVHANIRPVLAEWGMRDGSRAVEVLDELAPEDDDLVLLKRASSAWSGTSIDTVLRCAGVSHVVITGVVTDGCILNSAAAAWDLGYRVTVVDDACATNGKRPHDNALELLAGWGVDVVNTAALLGRSEVRAG